ncbi:hypothetical protein [Sulfurimonas sp.]
MKYSYIKPRKKSPITPELQIIFTFFAITLLMLFFTYAFLLYKDYSFEKDMGSIIEQKQELKANIKRMQNQISFIQKQKALAEKVFTQNMVLKDSIANLFDLVPQRITLSEAKLLKNGLILYGITPNKDVYNFMLQAPLRSIFHKTYSSFYPAKNGWLMFVSTNYIDESQVEELDSEN